MRQIRDLLKGKYAGCEFFKPVSDSFSWSGNDLRIIEGSIPNEAEAEDFRLFEEFDYNLAFWMPIGEHVSFYERFGSAEARLLCIVLPKSGQFIFRRRIRLDTVVRALRMPAESVEEAEQKAEAAILLGIWHKYLDYARKGFYTRKMTYRQGLMIIMKIS